jgi:hypothetical protein
MPVVEVLVAQDLAAIEGVIVSGAVHDRRVSFSRK